MDSRQAPVALSAEKVRSLAQEAGFDLCGFARPEPIPPESLVSWLEAGYAADMDWIANRQAERLDVKLLLPTAQTVVALACNYWNPDPIPEPPIARYARGRDYHATLKDRLRHFRRLLEELSPGIETYGSIDHGPMLEKIWAARAGLGYVGKNGCLITERFGSYVNLAVLLLDAPVDGYAGGPAVDRCGTCSACISSCPTDAIVSESVVDAGRCLSYQTIENRHGIVPESVRPAFAGVVFGCDLCQDVCPLNTHPVQSDPRFAPRAVASLGVREIAAMTPEQYAQLVPGSPLARAQYDGLRRNAAYALGAVKDQGARGILETLAGSESEKVRSAARWALAQLESARR